MANLLSQRGLIAVVALALIGVQLYHVHATRSCGDRTHVQLASVRSSDKAPRMTSDSATEPPPSPTRPPSSPTRLPPLPSPLPPPSASSDGCSTFDHTEMGGGTVVGGGGRLKLASAAACCQACQQHNTATPRPRGRINCTTWVYNRDSSHPQASECWLKRHDKPWADIELLAGGSRSWVTGVVLPPPPRILGASPSTRACGDARWHHDESALGPLYLHPRLEGVHSDELSLCPRVVAAEASLALVLGAEHVRIRLNRAVSPKAVAWIDALLAAGTCAVNHSSRPLHACHFYRAEAVVGLHTLPEKLLRDHQLDPRRLPSWGKGYWWGPPYAFIQGRLWHGGPGPWLSNATALPTEGTLPTLHRGTVELVGGGPDFLIALADHPMMPPHNIFGHVVEEDMATLDRLIEQGPIKMQNWGTINATVFERAVPFSLSHVVAGRVVRD